MSRGPPPTKGGGRAGGPRWDTAECRFLATSLPGNWPVFPDARQGSFAMAYGRVTIDTSLTGAARSPYEGMTMSGFTPPTFPVLGRYRSRLAWVAVVAHLDVYSCGIQGANGSPPRVRHSSTAFKVVVFDAVPAATASTTGPAVQVGARAPGSDQESSPRRCGSPCRGP